MRHHTRKPRTPGTYYDRHLVERRAYDDAHAEEKRLRNRKPEYRFHYSVERSKERGITFDLTFEQYAGLILDAVCHYCGAPAPKTGTGLDRKNSYLGYSEKNCVPCCRTCNEIRGKDNISYSEMFEVVKLLRKLRTKADAGDDFEEHF